MALKRRRNCDRMVVSLLAWKKKKKTRRNEKSGWPMIFQGETAAAAPSFESPPGDLMEREFVRARICEESEFQTSRLF